jgi:putative transposase
MQGGLKMTKEQLYYTNRHSVYFLQYHLVVVTKYRHPVIIDKLKERLFEISHSVLERDWNCRILEINSDRDHVHILFEAPPQVQPSKLTNNYKTVTSRLLRKEFSEFLKPYYWKPYFWSNSYFICTVSDRTEEMIRHYIQNQGAANPS